MVIEDEARYTGLKKEKELLDPERKLDYDHLHSKPHSAVYEEIPDSSNIGRNEDGYNLPQSHYEYVDDESTCLPTTNGRYINQAVAKGTEDEHGYEYPQIQVDVYEEIPDSVKD